MSESIRHSKYESSDLIPGVLLAPIGAQEEARSLLRRQLPVIREMIGDMEEQTGAGRRYTMEKVVAFFRQQTGRAVLAVGRRNAGVAVTARGPVGERIAACDARRPLASATARRPCSRCCRRPCSRDLKTGEGERTDEDFHSLCAAGGGGRIAGSGRSLHLMR